MSKKKLSKCFLCSADGEDHSNHFDLDYTAKNLNTKEVVNITFSCDFKNTEKDTPVIICQKCLKLAITNIAVYMAESEPVPLTKSDWN